MSEKGKGVLAYIFTWIGGLIVLYGMKDNERNTKIHAAQAIVIGIGYMVIYMIYRFIPVYIPFFSTIVYVLYIALVIIGIVKVNKGENDIEFDYNTGEKLINIFYCNPYSSWEKGGIERNHEFIRYIIPKGITFDQQTKKNVIYMMNNINNVKRKSMEYKTPYELFKNIYGEECTKKLHLTHIKQDEVDLSYKLLIK